MSTSPPELVISKDLSAGPEPLQKPTANSPHILIIGGGVTGLTIAWLLLDRGYHVTIISKQWASYGTSQRITSQIAGALWELPPTQCGGVEAAEIELDQGDLQTVQSWALESFTIYDKIARNPELARASGIKMRMCTSFHAYRVADDEITYRKMQVAKGIAPEGFHWGMDLAGKYGVNIHAHREMKDAYEHLAPILDTDMAMAFLMRLVRSKGAKMYIDTIIGDLLSQESHLLRTYHADAIVNATGMARETAADDEVFPLRGAVLRVINDGSDFPKVTSALIAVAEIKEDGTYEDIPFIVPRSDNILVLGSIEHPHEYKLDLTPDSPEIKVMRERCEKLLPALKNARLDPEYPLAQGLRPYRNSRIRLQRESRKRDSRIVHCYGHGGAGWSLAFGSSRECVRLVEETVGTVHKRVARL